VVQVNVCLVIASDSACESIYVVHQSIYVVHEISTLRCVVQVDVCLVITSVHACVSIYVVHEISTLRCENDSLISVLCDTRQCVFSHYMCQYMCEHMCEYIRGT